MAALSSVGTQFSASYGSDFSELNDWITAIRWNGISTSEIETTALSSSDKTFVMGVLDTGTIEVEFILPPANTHPLVNYAPDPLAGYQIAAIRFGSGAGSRILFSYVLRTGLSVQASPDDVVRVTMTLRCMDDIQWQG